MPYRVDRLPGDEHGHDGRLPGAGGELEGEPLQPRIGLLVRGSQEVEEAAAGGRSGCDLGQPDRGLRRFDLAEEGADAGRGVVAPVVQQAGRLRRDLPLVRGQLAPVIDDPAQVVDDRRRVVLLAVGLELLGCLVEDELALAALPPGSGDRRDQGDASSPVEYAVRGLAVLVELPVTAGVLVGRVQDRLAEELVHQTQVTRSCLRDASSRVMVSTVLVRFATYGDSSLVVANRSRNAGGSFGTVSDMNCLPLHEWTEFRPQSLVRDQIHGTAKQVLKVELRAKVPLPVGRSVE